MQLTQIKQITGTLVLKTGLHIGAGDTEMRIGGTDNPVVRNPLDGQPYIPGSSLKGKIRSLLEWQLGLVTASNGKPFSFQHLAKADSADARSLLRLFGGAPGGDVDDLVAAIGPTRLALLGLSTECRLAGGDSRPQLAEPPKPRARTRSIALPALPTTRASTSG